MPAKELTALLDKIVTSKKGRRIDIQLSLDLCELVKMRAGNARIALDKVLDYVNGYDKRHAFFALNLLEVLMLNGGFPVRFVVSRKEWLNALVKQFPAAPRKTADDAEEYICLLLSKWTHSLAERSRFKEEYSNFSSMNQLLSSKGIISMVI
jgi:hypothetical protein